MTVKNDAVEGVNRFLSYLFKQVSLLFNLQKAPVVGNMLLSNTFICSSFFQSSSAIKGDAIFAATFVSFSSACQVCCQYIVLILNANIVLLVQEVPELQIAGGLRVF